MFAHVKYLDVEGSYCNVPVSFIKQPFNHAEFNPNVTYEVFWSPNEEETPDNVSVSENIQAVSKDGVPKAGYYKAIVLLVADDEESLEKKLRERRVRVMPEKFLKSPHISKVDGDFKSMKANKKDSKKTIKESSEKGKAQNLKRLETLKEINEVTERRTKRKLNSLFEAEGTKIESDSLSSEENSEDEVVPKKFLKTSESQLEKAKDKYYELKKRCCTLKEEKEAYKSKYSSLETKYKDLKTKYDNLLDLNSKMQYKILDYFDNFTGEFPITKNTVATEKNTPQTSATTSNTVHPYSSIQSTSSSLSLTPQHTLKTKTSSPSPTWALPLDGMETLSGEIQETPPKIQAVESSLNENHRQDVDLTFSQEKLNAVRLNVKKGTAGDSQYAKNLATAMWSSSILSQRSVSGRKGNYKGDGQAKKRLTPQKMDYLRELFIERLRSEKTEISEEEIELRCKSIPTYISQKIATLKRVVTMDKFLDM